MNVRDAAILVLREAKKPLHATEITESILSMGAVERFWQDTGSNGKRQALFGHQEGRTGLRPSHYVPPRHLCYGKQRPSVKR